MPSLAYADTFDPSRSNFIFILIATGGTAAVAVLAGIVIMLARRNPPRRRQFLIGITVFWGFATVCSLMYVTLQQLAWQKQFQQDLMSGYGDPNAVGPGLHLAVWITLAIVYFFLLGLTLSGRQTRTNSP